MAHFAYEVDQSPNAAGQMAQNLSDEQQACRMSVAYARAGICIQQHAKNRH